MCSILELYNTWCISLGEVIAAVTSISQWDVSIVVSMKYMFLGAHYFTGY